MIIREVRTKDVPALSELARKTYAEAFGHSLKPDDLAAELEENRLEAYFRSAMNAETILVAVTGARLVGYIQLGDVRVNVDGRRPGEKDQAVNALYVHSALQGQGIGRALMDAAFESLRFQQARDIYIDVWDENRRAVDFYLNYGFKIVGKCDVITNGKYVGQDLVLKRAAVTRWQCGQ